VSGPGREGGVEGRLAQLSAAPRRPRGGGDPETRSRPPRRSPSPNPSPPTPPPQRSVTGRYDTVTCIDVMIHYPQDKADAMISHLASLSDRRLVVSFAPKTPYYSILKRIGELFPGPSKVCGCFRVVHDQAGRVVCPQSAPASCSRGRARCV
jgi:hypothetical protein